MLTPRYIARLLVAFLLRFRYIILLGLLFGIVVFALFNWLLPKIFSQKLNRIGLVGRFHSETLPDSILSQISRGLTTLDESGTPLPGLAQSWESPDKGKTWVFHLGEDIGWQDGEKIISRDIKYDYSDVSIETKDDHTIVFKLESPFSPFPSIVAKPVFKKGLLGNSSWRVNTVSLAGGYIQKLEIENERGNKNIYKFYPTEERAKLAYKLGEVDVLEGLFNPNPFNAWKNANVTQEVDKQKEVVLFFNTKDALLSDKSLRQALAYAINKNSLQGERALSPISPLSWAYNPQVKAYNFDKERAEELLEDLPAEQRGRLNLKLVTSPILLDVAEAVVKDWNEIGVNTSLQVSSGLPLEYQAILAILEIPKDPDQYSIWHSTQEGSNVSKYQDPRIDALLENGRIELNLEGRRTIYLDFQRFLLEDAPAVFLYHPLIYKVERK